MASETKLHTISYNLCTVEPRFNEVPGTGEICLLYRGFVIIENLDITNFWKNNQNVRYIEIQFTQLIIVFNVVTLHYTVQICT